MNNTKWTNKKFNKFTKLIAIFLCVWVCAFNCWEILYFHQKHLKTEKKIWGKFKIHKAHLFWPRCYAKLHHKNIISTAHMHTHINTRTHTHFDKCAGLRSVIAQSSAVFVYHLYFQFLVCLFVLFTAIVSMAARVSQYCKSHVTCFVSMLMYANAIYHKCQSLSRRFELTIYIYI